MQRRSNRPVRLGICQLTLACALLIVGCGGPTAHSSGTSHSQSSQLRVIVHFSSPVDPRKPSTLAMLSEYSNAEEARYVRSLSGDAHIYLFTLRGSRTDKQLLQGLRTANGIRAVELDQKAFEQSP